MSWKPAEQQGGQAGLKGCVCFQFSLTKPQKHEKTRWLRNQQNPSCRTSLFSVFVRLTANGVRETLRRSPLFLRIPSSFWPPEVFPSCLCAAAGARPSAAPPRTKCSLEEPSGGRQTEMDGGRGTNPFRDVNKIKEPDMIKHEVHHKGNVNLSSDPFIIKHRERRSAARQRGEFMRPTSSI